MTFGNIVLVLFVLSHIADIITTKRAISVGGVESNPVVKWLMDKFGSGWVVVKLLASLTAGGVLYYTGWLIPLMALTAFTFFIAYRNYKITKDLERK